MTWQTASNAPTYLKYRGHVRFHTPCTSCHRRTATLGRPPASLPSRPQPARPTGPSACRLPDNGHESGRRRVPPLVFGDRWGKRRTRGGTTGAESEEAELLELTSPHSIYNRQDSSARDMRKQCWNDETTSRGPGATPRRTGTEAVSEGVPDGGGLTLDSSACSFVSGRARLSID